MDIQKIEKAERIDALCRAASLLSIMLGAFVFGAAVNPLESVSVPPAVVAFVAVVIGSYGVSRGGIIGMIIFAVGNVLVGSAMLGGMIPAWAGALGMLVAIPGLAYRIIRPD